MLTINQFHDIPVFDIIECPICDSKEFQLYGVGGAVFCQCGTKFEVEPTGGDAGCVVRCDIDGVWGKYLEATEKWWLGEHYNRTNHRRPGVRFYRVMKGDKDYIEDSFWIIESKVDGVHPYIWDHMAEAVVKKEESK